MGLPHFILLYVDEPQASAEFYARLLDRKPLDSSPNFVMFELSPDLRLGLWARRDVEPAPGSAADTGELAMRLQPTKRSKRSAPIGSAKVQPSSRNRLQWTLAGPSWSRTPTDIGFGCFAPRLEGGPRGARSKPASAEPLEVLRSTESSREARSDAAIQGPGGPATFPWIASLRSQ